MDLDERLLKRIEENPEVSTKRSFMVERGGSGDCNQDFTKPTTDTVLSAKSTSFLKC